MTDKGHGIASFDRSDVSSAGTSSKKLIALACIFASVAIAAAVAALRSEGESEGILSLSPKRHNFGTVNSGETKRVECEVVNESAEIVQIMEIIAPCSCTVATVGKRSLPPHGKTTMLVDVTFFPKDTDYAFSEEVQLLVWSVKSGSRTSIRIPLSATVKCERR